MSESNNEFWESNVESGKELLPAEYDMTIGFDFVFDAAGNPKILELNGTRSGLSGVSAIKNEPADTGLERLKRTMNEIRGRIDTARIDIEKWKHNLEAAGFTDDTHGEVPPEHVALSLAVALKYLIGDALQYYPDEIPTKTAAAIKQYASVLVKHDSLLHGEQNKLFVNAPQMPEVVNYLISDKLFFRVFVPPELRPREFDEMDETEQVQVSQWVVKNQRGIQGSGVRILENTLENRAAVADLLKDTGALFWSVQEYIESQPADNANATAPAALRYLHDVHVQGDDYEVVYGGGYQRVGAAAGEDQRIVNKTRGASSYDMSQAEQAKILPAADLVTQEVVEVVSWLRRSLERAQS